jgi:hypothetical protein
MFLKDSETVILMKEGHQEGAEDQKENKIHGCLKKFLLRELVHQNLGN